MPAPARSVWYSYGSATRSWCPTLALRVRYIIMDFKSSYETCETRTNVTDSLVPYHRISSSA
eukprot:scaffold275724_cov21-Prasinocladus_malaysianus.AAC.1